VSPTKDASGDQVIFQLLAQENSVENGPYGWARSELGWAQTNLTGIAGGSLNRTNRLREDSADPATLSYTWVDGGVSRRVVIIVRERDKHLYFFAIAAPTSEYSAYAGLFADIVSSTKFD
jgi:hypothetical protein